MMLRCLPGLHPLVKVAPPFFGCLVFCLEYPSPSLIKATTVVDIYYFILQW